MRRLYIFGLLGAHLLFAVVAFGPTGFPGRAAFLTGLADCELTLAVVILMFSSWRWATRVPIVLVLFFMAWAGHYVYVVDLMYPFVFAEEYLITFGTGLAVIAAFWLLERLSRLGPVDAPHCPPKKSPRFALSFTILDLLYWTLGVAIILSIGERAMSLTDVSGMNDPWESIEFAVMSCWDFVLPRLPVLLLAWLLYGALWGWVARILLTAKRWTWLTLISVILTFLGLNVGEVAVSSCMIFYEKPWPFLPASMVKAVHFVGILHLLFFEHRWEFMDVTWRDLTELSAILLTRLTVFSGSLLLLRGAGLRYSTAKSSSASQE
jgi:hypothetical protein